ncbi:hypothetical protein HDU83_001732 [Entophlyctis luteolus]|nr:hypothetical protein HDU83_001732 [Entophlyctis luteolus]
MVVLNAYVLPKGIDALYRTLYSKSWIIGVPHFEVAMFGAVMGLIVMHFKTEPDALGAIIFRLLRQVDLTIGDAECISRTGVTTDGHAKLSSECVFILRAGRGRIQLGGSTKALSWASLIYQTAGDHGTGKSAFLRRHIDGGYNDDYEGKGRKLTLADLIFRIQLPSEWKSID